MSRMGGGMGGGVGVGGAAALQQTLLCMPCGWYCNNCTKHNAAAAASDRREARARPSSARSPRRLPRAASHRAVLR